MNSAIAVITYRRAGPLKEFLESIEAKCPQYPVAVFEDCATSDGTAAYLMAGAEPLGYDAELDSDGFKFTSPSGWTRVAYLGRRNEGVAGQSNKAIRWMERNKYEHLCLCNDDLIAKGDFPKAYAHAHTKTGVGLFTFCDLKNTPQATYEGPSVPVKGLKVKILPRMVGIMLSVTKEVVEKVGYFDATYGRFGNEHCDYNNRARLYGFVNLNNQAQLGLDIETTTLQSQPIPSSILSFERPSLDARANKDASRAEALYRFEHLYRPFRLPHSRFAQAFGDPEGGIPVHDLERLGYTLVIDRLV